MRTTSLSLNSLLLAAVLLFASGANASGLDAISSRDASSGVREALTQGADYAVGMLGKENGFLDNDQVRIPLPDSLKKIEKGLKMFGMGKQSDALVTSMNHAAEAAVAEAKPILMDAIRNMSVNDAKNILTGGDESVTRYFRESSSEALGVRFAPIVKGATAKVKLAEQYNKFAGKAASLGLIDDKDADLDSYVTQKAMDGLFAMIADQERKLRQNPLGAGSALLKNIFGRL